MFEVGPRFESYDVDGVASECHVVEIEPIPMVSCDFEGKPSRRKAFSRNSRFLDTWVESLHKIDNFHKQTIRSISGQQAQM